MSSNLSFPTKEEGKALKDFHEHKPRRKGCRFEKWFLIPRHKKVCCDCRICLSNVNICPSCGKEMVFPGPDFAAPPKHNENKWKVVKFLLDHNVKYRGDCCGWRSRIIIPETMQYAIKYVESKQIPNHSC